MNQALVQVSSLTSLTGSVWMTAALVAFCVAALLVSSGLTSWTLHQDRRRRDLQQMIAELQALSTQDPLTGVLNRRGLWQAHADWAARAPLQGAMLVVLDLNEFRSINGRYGHAAGDACLQALAQVMRSVARPGDLLARVGSDEFVVVLTGTPAERNAQLEGLRVEVEIQGVGIHRCTASLGRTVIWPIESLDEVLQRADQDMLMARAARRAQLERVWADINTPLRGEPN